MKMTETTEMYIQRNFVRFDVCSFVSNKSSGHTSLDSVNNKMYERFSLIKERVTGIHYNVYYSESILLDEDKQIKIVVKENIYF